MKRLLSSLPQLFALVTLGLVSLCWAPSGEAQEEAKAANKITFEDHVQPILRTRCGKCHNASKKSGDLDLSNYTNLMLGGGSGEVIERGSAADSYLYLLITHESEPFMPPKSEKIPEAELTTIHDWIEAGAPENSGSKVMVKKKPKISMATTNAGERPEVAPLSARLSLQPTLRTTRTGAVTAIATSPWAPIVAIAAPRQILLYDSKSLKLTGVLPYPEGIVEVLKFSRNGSLLLAGGGRPSSVGKVIVWDISTGERVIEVGDEYDSVLGADISSDHSLIALGSASKVVRVYSTATGELEYEIPKKHTEWLYCLEFSPDGILLATADRNGGLFVWEAANGREYLKLGGHGGAITGMSWRLDSNILGTCSEDGSIKLWEMENGGQVKNWGAHGGGASSMEFARDGRIISCGRDRVVKIWDQNGAQQRAFEALGDIALQVSFCDESDRAIGGDWAGEVRIWNAADGVQLGNLTTNPPLLNERLVEAQAKLEESTTTYKPLAETATTSRELATKAQADLVAADKAVVDTQKTAETTATRLATADKDLKEITVQYEATSALVKSLEPVVPLLTESLAKALAAAEQAKDDKQLADAAAALRTVTEARSKTFADGKTRMAEEAILLQTAKQTFAAADKAAKDAAVAYKDAQAVQVTATAAVKPATEKATADEKTAADAHLVMTTADELTKHWQAEINFMGQLAAITEQRNAALVVLAEHEQLQAEKDAQTSETKGTYDAAVAAQAAAQKVADDAKLTYETTLTAVETAKTAFGKAEAEHQTATKNMTNMDGAIKALIVAMASAKEAVTKSPEDKDLAAAAESLTALVAKKQAELEEMKKIVPVKLAAVVAAKQVVVDNEKRASDANTVLADAVAQVEARAAEVKPLEATLAANQKLSTDAAATTATAQQGVDEIQQQLDTLRQPLVVAG